MYLLHRPHVKKSLGNTELDHHLFSIHSFTYLQKFTEPSSVLGLLRAIHSVFPEPLGEPTLLSFLLYREKMREVP